MLLAASAGWACDIPVYEYALYNWQRGSYYVVYFHRGAPADEDGPANAMLERLAGDEEGKANLYFKSVDVDRLDELPPDSVERDIWQWDVERKLPCHVVVAPHGVEFFAGRLSEADVRDMSESAFATEMARTLSQGEMGVLLVLLSGDEAADAKARKALDEAMAEAKQMGEQAAVATLRRDDHKERWLVRQLLAVEPGLTERPEPMVFGAFGRGRVVEPCIGGGITSENLVQLIAFMNGPCSCVTKTGVGVDVLTSFNWRAALSDEWDEEQPPTRSAAGVADRALRPVGMRLWLVLGIAGAAILAVFVGGGVLVLILQRGQR